MSDTYNDRDVKVAFDALCEEAMECGLDASSWDIEMRSGSNRNYKLIGAGTSAITGNFGALGTDARQATQRLQAAAGAMAMVRRARLS